MKSRERPSDAKSAWGGPSLEAPGSNVWTETDFQAWPRRRAMRAWVVLVMLSLAGCAAPATVAPLETTGTAPAPAAPDALGWSASGCGEGGGHSVHPMMFNPLPKPWKPADILDDVGPQVLYSEVPDPTKPVPQEGSTIGNWHVTMQCKSWTWNGVEKKDLLFGYVGMKVERPPFGDEAPAREHIVTIVAPNDPDIVAAFHMKGIHAMM